jgi:serine/threonine-protein kinase
VAPLGKGGMGEVYRADDLTLGQAVALKFLPADLADDPDRLARFRGEVRVARQVSHPHVCRVYDIGEADGQIFLTMEYVDGEDLAALLRRIGRLPPDKGAELGRQLCLGLAAAHDKGVLHRDLKPQNVMIDGRGQARLTDFGLAAAAADVRATEVRSGTPAYQAPEVLAGREVSVQSDLYALGLVLYELFTGRRAFPAETRGELERLHAAGKPPRPSAHAPGIDPRVERVILRCLEPDPRDRPRSALQVAAVLPGADPLAEALAAGQTPSPEAVADAGGPGDVPPAVGLALLSAVLVGIVLVAALADRTMLYRRVPLTEPPEALASRARGLLADLGHGDRAGDRVYYFMGDPGYLRHVLATDPGPGRWDALADGRPAAMSFFYRQSPRALASPADRRIQAVFVLPDNPPLLPGMAAVRLDPVGRLLELAVAPPEEDPEGGPDGPPDWGRLLAAAGLDRTAFAEAPPQWNPPLACDARAAWVGEWPGRPGDRLRAEAGGYRGKPVFFRLVGPWTRPERPGGDPGGPAGVVVAAALLVAAGLLVARNLRLGRGDRRGAFRLAAAGFGAQVLAWVLGGHHTPDAGAELYGFVSVLGLAAWSGGFLWLCYLAVEPLVRKRWPGRLRSWNRLLAGRFRDPLVGRDLLIGFAVGAGVLVLWRLKVLLPPAFGLPPPAPITAEQYQPDFPFFTPLPFYFTVRVLGRVLVNPLILFFLAFVLQLIFRLPWLSWGAFVLLQTALSAGGGGASGAGLALQVTLAAVEAVVLALLMARFGLLPLACYYLCVGLLSGPVCTDVSAWYFPQGLAAVVAVAGLAVYGFFTALGNRPLFGKDFFGDE